MTDDRFQLSPALLAYYAERRAQLESAAHIQALSAHANRYPTPRGIAR